MLTKIPIIVHIGNADVEHLDLLKELKVDQTMLGKHLERQAAQYGKWSQLYATAASKVAQIKESLDQLEAKLFVRYTREKKMRVTDIKYLVWSNQKYKKLQKKLRLWQSAERHLKFAEKAFDQRLSALMCLNANSRKESRYGD